MIKKDCRQNLQQTPDPATVVPVWLAWFDQAGRRLPWRQNKDAYAIWVSEIMLQQTQVQTVIPYYNRFMTRFPTVFHLAGASETEVLKHWEGLGYYARAWHLLAAARQIVNQWAGRLPETAAALKALPGIGDYTAGAILSMTWQKSVPAVDGNVVRVFSRLTGTPWRSGNPADRRTVAALVKDWLPQRRPGDFNEAIMDLGATICLPREPRCAGCPLNAYCVALQEQRVKELPLRREKKAVPVEQHTVIVLHRQSRWHVMQRPAHGLLAGLYTFDWLADDKKPTEDDGMIWSRLAGHTHRFTHLVWQLDGYLVDLGDLPAAALEQVLRPMADAAIEEDWVTDDELKALPFPAALEPFRLQSLAKKGAISPVHP